MQDSVELNATSRGADIEPTTSDNRSRWSVCFWLLFFFVTAGISTIGYFVSQFTTGFTVLAAFFLVPFSIVFVLLGGFAGFAKHRWRWIVAPLSSLLVSFVIAYCFAGSEFWYFIFIGFMLTLLVGIGTHFLRVVRGELEIVEANAESNEAFQFGIKDMLVLTASVAVFVVVGQIVLDLNDGVVGNDVGKLVFLMVGCVICLSLPLLVNFWLFFGQRLTRAKIIVNVIATIVAIFAINFVLPDKIWWPTTVFINQIVFGLLMMTLRNRGFRFVKRAVVVG